MFVHTVKAEGLAHLSYVVGDGARAAVIDPRRDMDVYLELARQEQCRITHIFETHRNEDYAIGSLDLARLTGAEILHGPELPFEYGSSVTEGQTFDFGKARLTVLSTPGHTFESISIVLADSSVSPDALGVFTGDALMVGDVGRTDFFPDRAEEVAGLLYDSLFEKLLPLGDHVIVYPAHGAGSVCGSHMADRDMSTIGYERRHNHALQQASREAFIGLKTSESHHYAPWFPKMEEYNLRGAPPMHELPQPRPLDAGAFAAAMAEGAVAVDCRSPEAFGAAHIPGSLSIPLHMMPAFAGWFLPYDRDIALVVEHTDDVEHAVRYLVRIGYDRVEAFLAEGLHGWEVSGRRFAAVPQVHVGDIVARLGSKEPFTLLDVRSDAEFAAGHLPGATNVYVGQLPDRLGEVPPARPIITICASGRRASIAASILRRHGLEDVINCLGSMAACGAAGCPIVREGPDAGGE